MRRLKVWSSEQGESHCEELCIIAVMRPDDRREESAAGLEETRSGSSRVFSGQS
jgi:hypothetical protein